LLQPLLWVIIITLWITRYIKVDPKSTKKTKVAKLVTISVASKSTKIIKMTYNKKLGCRLKDARKKSGLTQEAVAKKFGFDKSTISKYESGSNAPDVKFLKDFAELLNVNGDWLLFGEPPIFKASGPHKDIEVQILELLSTIKKTKSEYTPKNYITGDFKHSIETLTDDTPENYITLIDYMVKNPTARRDVLKYFHLFIMVQPEAEHTSDL
jgi:transcriptional regulator with XRE-family HTH domain